MRQGVEVHIDTVAGHAHDSQYANWIGYAVQANRTRPEADWQGWIETKTGEALRVPVACITVVGT